MAAPYQGDISLLTDSQQSAPGALERLLGADPSSDPKQRQATNLPDRQANWHIPISVDDLADGSQWPPSRARNRTYQTRRWAKAAEGDYSDYLVDPSQFGPALTPRIGTHAELVTALLLASPPTVGDNGGDQMLADAVGCGGSSLLHDASALAIGTAHHVEVVPGCYVWPLQGVPYGEGWVIVEPPDDRYNTYDETAAVRIILGNTMAGTIRKWSGGARFQGRLGAVQDVLPTETVMHSLACRTPKKKMWGTSMLPKLLPTAVALHRREQGMDYMVESFERPIVQAKMSAAIGQLKRTFGDFLEDATSDAEVLRKLAPMLTDRDVVALPPGVEPMELLERLGDISGSTDFYGLLLGLWANDTGFSPTESADSSDVSSGVAVARRNARGVALTKGPVFAPLYTSLKVVVPDMEWDYVDTITGQATDTDPGMMNGDGGF